MPEDSAFLMLNKPINREIINTFFFILFTFLWCMLKGSVATVVGSEERGVFRHNYLLKP
jgi:hypothetical protein